MTDTPAEDYSSHFIRYIGVGLVVSAIYVIAINDSVCDSRNGILIPLLGRDKPYENIKTDSTDSKTNKLPFFILNTYTEDRAAIIDEKPRPNKNTDNKNDESKWIQKLFCDLKFADIAMAFFTYCLVIVTWELAKITERLWSAGERQIAVASQSAGAAMAALEHAKAVFEEDHRAWIDIQVTPGGDFIYHDMGFAFKIKVDIENIGKAPAYDVRINSSFGLSDGIDVPPEFEEKIRNDVNSVGKLGIIMPNGRRTQEVGVFITYEAVNMNKTSVKTGCIYPSVLCISDYTSGSKMRRTAITFGIAVADGENRLSFPINGGTIPRQKLVIVRSGVDCAT